MRSLIAVAAGFFVLATLSLGADALVRALWPTVFDASGATSNPAALVIALVYSSSLAVLGAYVAATVAAAHRMRHALVLGLIALLVNAVVAVQARSSAPPWYHLWALALVLPAAWIGGRLGQHTPGTRVVTG